MTRIYVDKSRCEASQLCVATHPEAFDLGDDGCAYLIDEEWVAGRTEEELETVMTLCPTDAIRKVPEGGEDGRADALGEDP